MKKVLLSVLLLVLMCGCGGKTAGLYTVTDDPVSRVVVCYGAVVCGNVVSEKLPSDAVVSAAFVEQGDSFHMGDTLIEYRTGGKSVLLVAQCDGIVSECAAFDGARLKRGEKIIEYYDMTSLYISASVPEADATLISPGMSVSISGSGFRRNSYSGSVIKLYALAEQTATGVFLDCSISVDEADTSMIPGFTAKVEISVPFESAVCVPTSAVGYDNGFFVVRVIDGITERVSVNELVPVSGGYAVRSPITAGETILADSDEFRGLK